MEENRLNHAEEFFLNRMNQDKIFAWVERGDYVVLHEIKALCEKSGGQAYLTDLAEQMNRPIHEVSKMMGKLQDKGYVIWSTDENKERTFLKLTDKASTSLEKEQEQMERLYKKMQETIDPQQMKITMETLKQIHEIIYAEE